MEEAEENKAEEAGEDLPLPETLLDQEPPENTNVYSDGSLKNPRGGAALDDRRHRSVVARTKGGDAAEDRSGGKILEKQLRNDRPANVERL